MLTQKIRAGAGSDVLFKYDHSKSTWETVGIYLVGIGCNPYPNGISYEPRRNRLHVTWTNRHFIDYDGANDPNSTIHKAQAGPNGPENNQDLCYAASDNLGKSWFMPSSSSSVSAGLDGNNTIDDDTPNTGIISIDPQFIAVNIPKHSGIMNQEAQCVDTQGGVHVLNRDNRSGTEFWKHYYVRPGGTSWDTMVIPDCIPTATGPRGTIAYGPASDSVYFALPSNEPGKKHLTILQKRRSPEGTWQDIETLWQDEGYDGEPLVDEEALLEHGLLSVFTTWSGDKDRNRRVVVLNFNF